MKKAILGMLLAAVAAGCAWGGREAASVWENTEGPVVSAAGQTQDGVLLTVRKPAASCVFKGGVLGDSNPAEGGIPSSVLDISARIRQGLVSSAKNMGGNTVWFRTASWDNPDVSADYYRDFVVNNVEYTALVYDCPAE